MDSFTPAKTLELAIEILKEWDSRATKGPDFMPATRMLNAIPSMIGILQNAQTELTPHALDMARAIVGISER